MVSILLRLVIAVLFVAAPLPALAGNGQWNTVGLRAGTSDSRSNESFSQYEAYVTVSLPWNWQSDSNWMLGTFLGANAGLLTCAEDAFVGSIGPGVYLMTPARRVVLSAGIYPTYLGRSEFGRDHFGGSFQFTSTVGINFIFLERMTTGYRFQHMSNAGLADKNPGLNTHMIEAGIRF
jgi:lipid A 3-O-deacylase